GRGDQCALRSVAPGFRGASEGDGVRADPVAELRAVRRALPRGVEAAGAERRPGADGVGAALDPAVAGQWWGDGLFAGGGAGVCRDGAGCGAGGAVSGRGTVVVDDAGLAHLLV